MQTDLKFEAYIRKRESFAISLRKSKKSKILELKQQETQEKFLEYNQKLSDEKELVICKEILQEMHIIDFEPKDFEDMIENLTQSQVNLFCRNLVDKL